MITLTYSAYSNYPAIQFIHDVPGHIENNRDKTVFVAGICLNIGRSDVRHVREIIKSFI